MEVINITEEELRSLCVTTIDNMPIDKYVKDYFKEDIEDGESYITPDKKVILKLIAEYIKKCAYERESEFEQENFNFNIETLINMCDNNSHIIVASICGGWQGRKSGIPTIHTCGKEVINRINGRGNFDNIEFNFDNEKVIEVTGIHHDGRNYYYVLPFNVGDNDSIQIDHGADANLINIKKLIENNILSESQVNIIQETLDVSTNLKVCSCS